MLGKETTPGPGKGFAGAFAAAAAWVLLLAVICGCAPAIKTRVLFPAKAYEASMHKRIAVLPFSGSGGQRIAAELEQVINEQKLSLSGLVDEETATGAGRLAGAEAIVMGNLGARAPATSVTRKPAPGAPGKTRRASALAGRACRLTASSAP